MQNVKNRLATINPATLNKVAFGILVRILLVLFILYAIYAAQASRTDTLPPGIATISRAALEEKYGLRVNLVAVTAAGGFVDVRLKILDGEKARVLLTDSNNFPSLFAENSVALNASAEAKQQEIRFEDNGNLFIMFANADNAVKPGSQVRILFGDLALEPLDAQ